MARDGSIELDWPDQTRTYRLKLGELRQLQEKCDKGPMEILAALTTGRWRVDDVIQPIRLGLIGGGMPMDEALRVVTFNVHDGNLGQAVIYAVAIVQAAIAGPPDEKLRVAKGKKTTPATAGSSSQPSTAKARSSAGRRHK